MEVFLISFLVIVLASLGMALVCLLEGGQLRRAAET